MFKAILIANRGEIACRVIRTARAMGLRTIAVYSQIDRDARHVRMADDAVSIGGPHPDESYLRADNILHAAQDRGADCIHPGYGFLSENAAFAEACAVAGVTFIGPSAQAIRTMGRKDEAKALMQRSGVPILPGHDGDMQDPETLARAAEQIGFPVMIKAVAGGGGTGMRRVDEAKDLTEALAGAEREAETAFGEARVMIEKCLDRPRHIEVQILADTHGTCVHLFERDCSLQRRHQKVIEEAPAPGVGDGLRARMTSAALKAVTAVGYTGVGTVEFLVEESPLSNESSFYFLEMNTRLQVEHPVSEQVTGLDLVEWQMRVAAGEPLTFTQDDISAQGHAVEARLYAEDPDRDFLPSAGPLYLVRWPSDETIRIETGIETGDSVSPFYDPLLAKVIATGTDRADAIGRLRAALGDTEIAGPKTNLAFLHDLLGHRDVAAGRLDTGLIGRDFSPSASSPVSPGTVRAGLEALLRAKQDMIARRRVRFSNEKVTPWNTADGFSLAGSHAVELDLLIGGESVQARVHWSGGKAVISFPGDGGEDAGSDEPDLTTVVAGERVFVLDHLRQTEIRLGRSTALDNPMDEQAGVIRAPMHGRIVKIHVQAGDYVTKGERLAVLEAMKMEHILHAPRDGLVSDIAASEGLQVDEGAVIAIIGDAETT